MNCPNCGTENRSDASYCFACGHRLERPRQVQTQPPLPSTADRRYVAKSFLGEGGRKQVFRALDTRLDREVALSLIRTTGLDEASVERVRREARAMAKLGDHPNIVNIYDVGEEDGSIFLVAELMPRGSVDELIVASGGAALPIEQVLRIGRDVAGALQYAHEQGIVHRDVKPANVWLSRDGTSKLGDFGLAAGPHQNRITSEGMLLGTVAYMAPEQATGGDVDARSDLYSLGALLYEVATGRPPFAGADAIAVISQQINIAPVAPSWHNPQIPPELEQLVLDLLAKSPEDRPPSAAVVADRLNHIRAATPIENSRSSRQQDNPLDRLAPGVFVGREPETLHLRLMFEQARKGNGGTALLVGEPGIGKTRMAEELLTYARMAGAQVLTGRCHEGEGAPAYWPWIQTIRSYVHDRPPKVLASEMGSGAGHIAQIVSDVRQALPETPSPASSDPESARFQLFDSVATFLRNAARHKPLVVFLDDVHWADKSSLLLLEFLSRQLSDAPMLVICTYRDIELGRQHPLALTLASIIRETNTQRIVLRGLTEADVAQYIKLTAGIEPTPSVAQAIRLETEGNPFFVSETVRLLAAEGRLERADRHSWSVQIPQGVKEVIGRRLDRLSPECNKVLTTASVIGREFELPVIELLFDLTGDALLELLDEAVAARVVDEVSTGKYRFAHALIRETLYDELSTARRLRLHKAAAQALEKLAGDNPERYISELAHHFGEAAPLGVAEEAISYARRAGDKAMQQLAYEDAVSHFERALQSMDLQDSPDENERSGVLLSLGRAQVASGEPQEALRTFQSAFHQARVAGAGESMALAALGAGDVWTEVSAVNQDLVALLEEAAKAVSADETPLRIKLLARLAEAYRFDPETKHKEKELAGQAIQMARKIGDPEALGQALYAQIIAFGQRTDIERQMQLASELIEIAESTGDVERELLGLRLRMSLSFLLGHTEQARRDVLSYGKIAARAKLPLYTWFTPLFEFTFSFAEGRIDQAQDLLGRARRAAGQAGEPNADNFTLSASLSLAQEQQDQERLRQLENHLSRPELFFWVWGELIYVKAAIGQLDEARGLIESLNREPFASITKDFGHQWNMGLLAEVCRELDDAELSSAVYAQITHPAGFGAPGYLAGTNGCGHHHLGVCATTMGRYDEALDHLDKALQIHQRAGFKYLATRTRLAKARLHARRKNPGDVDLSARLAGQVADEARQGSYKQTLQSALDLKLKLQGVTEQDTRKSIHVIAAEVQREPTALRDQTSPDGTVTIVFTDIENSTALNETLGDQRWLVILSVHDSIVRERVLAAGGTVVKSRGDGFMLAFPSARQALTAAIDIQRTLARRNEDESGSTPIKIRMGVHTGEVVKQSGDFFGRHVNYASRIADQATGGEILVSELTKALLLGSPEFEFSGPRTAALKGFPGTHMMFGLLWNRSGHSLTGSA